MWGLPAPGEYFGRYLIEGTLGRGGMGVVLLARQPDLDRTVALKLLSPELASSSEFVDRFRREAAALGRLDSAHVVRAYDAGEHDGWLYIATQHVPDGDLGQSLEREGPFAPHAALALIDQVLVGLRDAHAAGLLHRDIKPNNVLLRGRRPHLHAYLCDLGISQVTGSEASLTMSTIGTPAFMAPERFAGRPASVASDLYSMGCLLWCLVSGSAPYVGTHLSVIRAHEQAAIPQLREHGPVEHGLNALIRGAMAKDPERRFTSADHMRAVLASVATAPPPGSAAAPTQAGPVMRPPAAPLGALRPPAPVSAERAPAARRGRSRLLVGVAAVSVLAASVAGGYAVAAGTGDGEGAADGSAGLNQVSRTEDRSEPRQQDRTAAAPSPSDPADRPEAPTEPTADPTADSTAGPDAVPEPAEEPVGDVLCWDGSRSTSTASCAPLHGTEAMEWVFTSFDSSDPGCREELDGLPPGVVLEWRCDTVTTNGLPATLYLREWASVEAGSSFYEEKYGAPGVAITNNPGEVVFLGWSRLEPDQQAARIFSSVPFAVSLDAPGEPDPRNALKYAVRFQPARNFPSS